MTLRIVRDFLRGFRVAAFRWFVRDRLWLGALRGSIILSTNSGEKRVVV